MVITYLGDTATVCGYVVVVVVVCVLHICIMALEGHANMDDGIQYTVVTLFLYILQFNNAYNKSLKH